MNNTDLQYNQLVQKILDKGVWSDNRTGTRTLAIFGEMIRFNVQEGFPLLTTKKMFTKGIIHELLWFLNGDTNIKYLVDNGVNIWNADAYREYKKLGSDHSMDLFIENIKMNANYAKRHGELGPVYGKQWINFGGVNQIKQVVETLVKNPDSRRIMVSAWNPPEIDQMALPPCHYGFQLNTRLLNDKEKEQHPEKQRAVSLMWNQRSIDTGLGLPYNIASYAFLLHMFAQQANMVPDELIGSLGNTHIYENHIELLKEQISRESFRLPDLVLNKAENIFSYKYEDFKIENYQSHPTIKMDLSV